MQVSYGPPGQRGVTTMMAIGADDIGDSLTDQAVQRGALLAAGAWALGELGGNRPLANVALGGLLALFGVMAWTRCQGVSVTQPAPAPAPIPVVPTGWY